MKTGSHTSLYCFKCRAVTQHDQITDMEDGFENWLCETCSDPAWMPQNGQYYQVFHELRASFIAVAPIVRARAYLATWLTISYVDTDRAIWWNVGTGEIYLNPGRAKLLPERMLHRLFSEALHAIVGT